MYMNGQEKLILDFRKVKWSRACVTQVEEKLFSQQSEKKEQIQ